jgi:hypothetical protein
MFKHHLQFFIIAIWNETKALSLKNNYRICRELYLTLHTVAGDSIVGGLPSSTISG